MMKHTVVSLMLAFIVPVHAVTIYNPVLDNTSKSIVQHYDKNLGMGAFSGPASTYYSFDECNPAGLTSRSPFPAEVDSDMWGKFNSRECIAYRNRLLAIIVKYELAQSNQEATWRKQDAERKSKPDVYIGMSKSQVINSRWGYPTNGTRTIQNVYGTTEQWVYSVGNYLYFSNGVLTSIQKNTYSPSDK